MASLRERAEALCESAKEDSRISLTELSRTTQWRKTLHDTGMMRLTDRSDTTAFLVSVPAMNGLLDSIREYEAIIETMSVRDMVERRRNHETMESGERLASAARNSFLRLADGIMDKPND